MPTINRSKIFSIFLIADLLLSGVMPSAAFADDAFRSAHLSVQSPFQEKMFTEDAERLRKDLSEQAGLISEVTIIAEILLEGKLQLKWLAPVLDTELSGCSRQVAADQVERCVLHDGKLETLPPGSGISPNSLISIPCIVKGRALKILVSFKGDPLLAQIAGVDWDISEKYDVRVVSAFTATRDEILAQIDECLSDEGRRTGKVNGVVFVSGRMFVPAKLVVWDFDNVVGDTTEHYASAVGRVYWRIRAAKEADEIPSKDDPVYKEGVETYYRLLPEGPAAWLTISKGIEEANNDKDRPNKTILATAAYYAQYIADRSKIFAGMSTNEFLSPGVREFMSIMNVAGPQIDMRINTALDSNFFAELWRRPGLKGYFSDMMALSAEERKKRKPDEAKVGKLASWIEPHGPGATDVVVIDDSSKVIAAARKSFPGMFLVGLAKDKTSAAELIDAGVDVIIFNVIPTPSKFALLGVDNSDVSCVAPDVYKVSARSPDGDVADVMVDPEVKRICSQIPESEISGHLQEGFAPAYTPEDRQKIEKGFEYALQHGITKTLVIVNIKDFVPLAAAEYLKEMRKISMRYNGNVEFALVVEDDAEKFKNDMPSVFGSIAQARKAFGGSFNYDHVIVVGDGGKKSRNMPFTLSYLYEGLMPYSRDRSRLQEVMVRAGGLLLRMPGFGLGHVMVVASDSVFSSESMTTNNGIPIEMDPDLAPLVVPEVPYPPTTTDLSGKIVRIVAKGGLTEAVLAKPKDFNPDRSGEDPKDEKYRGLYFLTIWDRAFLNAFLDKMSTERMSDGRPFIEVPCDMFKLFFQSVTMSQDQWDSCKPADVNQADWRRAREISISLFGERLENVGFARMGAVKAFVDEGVLKTALPRVREIVRRDRNTVLKSPDVELYNAAAASLDHVVIEGTGIVKFGNNVSLSNVRIWCNGGDIEIPDGWTITDSVIETNGPAFKGTNGFLMNDIEQYRDGLGSEGYMTVLKGDEVHTYVKLLNGERILVSVPISADKKTLAGLKFGDRGLTLEQIQTMIDPQGTGKLVEQLHDAINAAFREAPAIFPLKKDAVEEDEGYKSITYPEAVKDVARNIMIRAEATPGQCWVSLEGLQGAGKTELIKALEEELGTRGYKIQVFEEDWYHRSRKDRDAQGTGKEASPGVHHYKKWHDWNKLREDLKRVNEMGQREGEVRLNGLYNRDKGGELTREEAIKTGPKTIFIYSGFYNSDPEKIGHPYVFESTIEAKRFFDLTIYVGISPEDSLAVKVGRDVWRPREQILILDENVYGPAFRRYVSTFDPASSADIALRVDNVARRDKISIVVPSRKRVFDDLGRIIPTSKRPVFFSEVKKVASLFRLCYHAPANNDWSLIVQAMERVRAFFESKWRAIDVEEKRLDIRLSALEKREAVDEFLRKVKAENNMILPGDIQRDVDEIRKRAFKIGIDDIIRDLIVWHRKPDNSGKKLVVAFETDWVPGIADKAGVQYNGLNPMVSEVLKLKAYFRSYGINNIEFVHAGADALAGEITKCMSPEDVEASDFSNVIVMASNKTLSLSSFQNIRGAEPDKKPCIATVDTSKLENWTRDNPGSSELLDIDLLEMMDLLLRLYIGIPPPASEIVGEYDLETRTITLIPKPIPLPIEELKSRYFMRREAVLMKA